LQIRNSAIYRNDDSTCAYGYVFMNKEKLEMKGYKVVGDEV
jgi:hypothetical protein